MRMLRRSLAAILMLVALLAGPARLTAAAADPDAATGTVSGQVTWSGPLFATPTGVYMDMTIRVTTPILGVSDEEGSYDMSLLGFSPLQGAAGTVTPGSGTITVVGPEGWSGSLTYVQAGTQFSAVGTSTSGGENHVVKLSLVVVFNQTTPPISNATVTGTATIADH